MQKQCKKTLEILHFPVRNGIKNTSLHHRALGHDCSLKNKARWVARKMFVCRTHTHTQNDFLNTDLVQICPRLEWKFHNCSLERNTAQIMSFTSVSLHLGTGWYNIGPALVDATKRISWRSEGSCGGHQYTTKIPRRTGQWSWIPGMDSGTIPGNSQLGRLVLPIPRECG